jgi:hypothetical protein
MVQKLVGFFVLNVYCQLNSATDLFTGSQGRQKNLFGVGSNDNRLAQVPAIRIATLGPADVCQYAL